MKSRTRHVHIIFGLAFLGAALTLWVWPETREASPIHHRTPVVRVDRVREITTHRTVRFSGVTRAVRRATLAFSVPGRLNKRPVEIGDHLVSGQVLAELDAREYRNAVNMARASVAELQVRAAQAERDRRRIQRLADAKAATTEELEQVSASADAVRASLSAANAQLDEARRVVDETTLYAPFSGTVTAVRLEPGEWAGPGRAVVELSGDGAIELKVEVPETRVARLSQGQPVAVELPLSRGKRISGTIKSVARAAGSAGRLFPVVALLEPAEGLSAGMAAELILEVETTGSLAVPVKSVLNPGSSKPYIFCLHDGRVRRVAVELGTLMGDRIIVRGELAGDDRVVVSGHTLLADGDVVEVKS